MTKRANKIKFKNFLKQRKKLISRTSNAHDSTENENMRKEDKQTPKETKAVEEISYQFKKLGSFELK